MPNKIAIVSIIVLSLSLSSYSQQKKEKSSFSPLAKQLATLPEEVQKGSPHETEINVR